MDLSFTPEEEAFRSAARAWIAEATPPDMAKKAAEGGEFGMPEIMQWHKILYAKGWVAPGWPAAFGGAGLSATERFILAEELELAGMPGLSPFGLVMVGPLIVRFGTDAQRARFLPKILSGEEVWCQGYSEPDAGSDLASLRMTAEDRGDHFVVNGQKTWTTYAQYADWIFCLVRTGTTGKKQEGISFLLIDLKTEGVEVKPMLTLGGSPAFCDTFFTDAKVPKENLLGPLDGGWTLAKALLGHERTLVGAIGPIGKAVNQAKRIASQTMVDGEPLLLDPTWRSRIARVEMRMRAHRMANYRTLAVQAAGRHPGPESSILKLVGSVLQQEADELCMDLMALNSQSWFNEPDVVPPSEDPVVRRFCYNRATTIYAGSNEIQRNIIATLVLGLPR